MVQRLLYEYSFLVCVHLDAGLQHINVEYDYFYSICELYIDP